MSNKDEDNIEDELKDLDYSSEEDEKDQNVKKDKKDDDDDLDSPDISLKDEDVSSDLPSDEDKKKDVEEIDSKLFSGEVLSDRKKTINEDELLRGNKLIDALVKGHTINIDKFKAKDEDSSEEEKEKEIVRSDKMVMGLGDEDYFDEYKRIFGDIEELPKGLRMWRIEKFVPVKIPIHHLGRFYTKETYLILNIKEESRGGKEVYLHMWMGNDTTMDKSGGGAFRFSELGGYLKAISKLNEIPARIHIQREEQAEESEEFKAYFEKYGGFSISEGGTSSGFKVIEKPIYDPTLYLIRNDRHSIQCALSLEVLNVRLVYLLDAGEVIYVWFGAKSSYFDRFKATEMATQIVNKERKGRAMVVQIEDGEEDVKAEPIINFSTNPSFNNTIAPPNPSLEFWRILGASKAPKITRDEAPSEDYPPYRFLQTQTKGQNFDLIEITERPLKQEMLSPKHCIIIDCFYTIYNWKGKNATEREKAASTILSKKFFEETANRPKWAKVVNIHQTAEPIFFREKFVKWVDYTKEETKKKNKVAVSVAVNKIDVQSMLKEKYFAPNLLDEGKGDIQVWCMTSTKPKFDRLSSLEEGVFNRNYSYIVLYSYLKKKEEWNHRDTKRAFMVYFWQGRRSSIRDYSAFFFGFLPAFSKKLKSQGCEVEYRVLEEGSEVEHFVSLFKRVIVVNDGIRYSLTDKSSPLPSSLVEEKIREQSKSIRFYDCRMQLPSETVRCMELPVSTCNLNSYSTHLLITPTTLYIWYGAFTKVTPSSSSLLLLLERFLEERKKVTFLEGCEDEDSENSSLFWKILGGKTDYCKFEKRNSFVPRLFLFFHDNGKLQVEELANYSQSNLKEERVYLLDCEEKIYLWYGSRSSQTLRMHALYIANSFVRLAAASRTNFIPLEAFDSGNESEQFKWRFHTWFVPPKSSFSIVEEKRENRRKRLEILEYHRRRDGEEEQQFQNTTFRIKEENNKIRSQNSNLLSQNSKLRSKNQTLLKEKQEDAISLKKKNDRDRERNERDRKHKEEMERLEREREQRLLERQKKRNGEIN
eukprot:TRINITY_DN8817_c0_g1_i1.p1 TRINITY_DN8817_c0_g1~~TRINITY_DN8817_c0_g1_i1.p1  ORF type:complete len:1040 (+),score=379.30 TRINITY_DN8817_c0_g1_i1:100-3219(+)